MIAETLLFLPRAAIVAGMMSAAVGFLINVPMACQVSGDGNRPARDRAVEVVYMMTILPALWATFGVVISPIAALAAAWVSYSF